MNSYDALTQEFNELEIVYLSAGGKTIGTFFKLQHLRERCNNLAASTGSVANYDWDVLIKRIDDLLTTQSKPVIQITEPISEDEGFKEFEAMIKRDFSRFLGSQRSHPNVKRNSKPKVRKYRGYGR